MNSTETKVANKTRCRDASQQGAFGCNAVHPIASTAPDIADIIDTDAIGIAVVDPVKITTTGDSGTSFLDVKKMNQPVR